MKKLSNIRIKGFIASLIIFISLLIPLGLFAEQAEEYDNNNPEIFDSKLFIVAGLPMMAADQTGDEVTQLWEIFEKKKHQIPSESPNIWGIKYNRKIMDGNSYFSYVIGKEVPRENEVPRKFGQLEVVPHKYAIFVHKGNIETVSSMYEFIYKTWFKTTPYIIDTKAPILERRVDIENDPNPKVYVYIPIMLNKPQQVK